MDYIVFKFYYSFSEYLERFCSIFKKINQCYKDNSIYEDIEESEEVLPLYLIDIIDDIQSMMKDT